jgi:hypothetical protein
MARSSTSDPLEAVVAGATAVRDAYVERLAPAIDEARERLAPVLDTARERVAPAVETARERLAPAADVTRQRAGAAVAALRGDVAEPARRRWPLALLFLALGTAIGALLGMRTQQRRDDMGWTPPVAASPGVMEDVVTIDGQREDLDTAEAEATRPES